MSHNSRLIINGGQSLHGTVRCSGAKNAALPILAACLMVQGDYIVHNVPDLADIRIMVRMLKALGVHAEYLSSGSVRISNSGSIKHIAPYELVTSMRASFFVAGPLLAQTLHAKVPLPGGCAIGARPLDLHLKGFKALGVDVSIEHGFVDMKASALKGASICLDFPSVGATENVMMAAALSDGETVITNAAREPEIVDLGEFLIQAGAVITGLGSSTITIQGVCSLKGSDYSVMPDRIEAGTFLMAGAITQGDVTVEGISKEPLEACIQKYTEMGLGVEHAENCVRVFYKEPYRSVSIETMPYPGFPTDMQAQMMALLVLVDGVSMIKETIFENRFMHANELMRMGANIQVDSQCAIITGVSQLTGAEVKMTDLRAGAALILAGLAAVGETYIYDLFHLERGYEGFTDKLTELGAHIR